MLHSTAASNCCLASLVSCDAGGRGGARDKMRAMSDAGILVTNSPAQLGSTMLAQMKSRA